ncbi:apyrase-like [Plodia interpunctella]|uniref:apyrase-like n=1 Tax=Plodia interpunctella TaxID=58824 RepID=UPI00236750BA|nr:apyrase-like [Plodia interpunctella]
MNVSLFLLSLLLSEIYCGVINDLYKVDIIHYNDFHARFEETALLYPVCTSNNTDCLGGFARLYHEVQTLLKEKPDALVLNAGDVFQGTYWYTLMKWNVTQKFINMLPNDAHAIGNHEYDDGPVGLAPYLAALRAPVLAANMDTSEEPSLNGLYKPHIVIERKGRKIGIIGLITTATASSSNSHNVIFLDPVETARKEAKLLTDEGVDIIIVLSHCGLDVDRKIANEVGENIDIIVGGHTHSLLWNGDPPSGENISGPYPIIEKSFKNPNHNVVIVTASAFTKYLGNTTVYFDKTGEMVSYDGEPVYLNRSIAEDAEMKSLMQPYTDYVHSLVDEVIGTADADFLGTMCGAKECELGNLIADSFLYAGKQMNVSDLPHVTFLLRNMIRGAFSRGNITRGAIINALPFTNKLVTLSLPGRYLVEALAHCMDMYWEAKPFNGPWMPQVAGMRVTLNTVTKTVEVSIKKGVEYVALDPERNYQVITMDFLSKGKNGFEMFAEHGKNVTYIGKDAEILENYIKMSPQVTPHLDNRLTVIN